MNLGQMIARFFGAAPIAPTVPMDRAGQTGGNIGGEAGRTSLDRLMATPDKLDRIAPPAMHQVQAGETLTSIAQTYGTSWQNLARINGLGAAEQIQAGAMLRLPAQDGAAAAGTQALPNSAPIAGEIPIGNSFMPGVMAQSSNSSGGLTSLAGVTATPPAPTTAQIAAPSGTGIIQTNPDGKQAEDFSLWCKSETCPNLDPDVTRHRWPCTACGRTGKASPLLVG
jgi:LysM repeat protein